MRSWSSCSGFAVNMYKDPWVKNGNDWTQYSGYYPAQGFFTVNYPESGLFRIGLIPAKKSEITPDPEAVFKTLEKISGKAEETMVVGDTVFDIKMGLNAGCLTCGVSYGNHSRKQLEEAGTHFIIDDFAEILNLV